MNTATRFRFPAVVGVILWSTSLWAQADRYVDPLPDQIGQNLSAIRVTVALDKAVYLPGEVGVITITLTNPLNSALLIPDPDDSKNVGLEVCTLGGRIAQAYGVDWSCPESSTVNGAIATRSIGPGETIKRTYRSQDPQAPGLDPWIGAMSNYPGQHKVVYGFGGEALFTVNPVHLEAFAGATVKGEQDDPSIAPDPHQVMVVAVTAGGQHIVCQGLNSISFGRNRSLMNDSNGNLSTDSLKFISPLVRVATVPGAVTKLQATSGDDGQLTITYYMADGVPHTIRSGDN